MSKKWSATMSNTRDTLQHLHGHVLPLKEEFTLIDGDKLMFPADPKGRPENIINCRWGIIYDVMEEVRKSKKIITGIRFRN